MIKTAHHEIYQELQQKKRLFKHQIHLFTFSLVMGILFNKKSDKTPTHDIIRLRALSSPELGLQRSLIEFLSLACSKIVKTKECETEILKYAEGGLELIWEEYQEQGILDLPRLFEKSKKHWSERIPELKEFHGI